LSLMEWLKIERGLKTAKLTIDTKECCLKNDIYDVSSMIADYFSEMHGDDFAKYIRLNVVST